ncbi:MAG TPA: glutamyl-tRNA reductase [Methanocorpusculum sp.]|nr:glutamyl-tRNA reductase [Methanocorpusculum sp.]
MIPLQLDLSNASVLVFGSGAVAKRKADYFKQCRVTYISREYGANVENISDNALSDIINKHDVIISALDDVNLNEKICEMAKSCGKLCNSATGGGNFLIPAVFCDGDVSVAVSANGCAPALAAFLRDDIKARYPNLAEVAKQQQEFRKAVKDVEPEEKKRAELIKLALPSPDGEIRISLASFTGSQDALFAAKFDEAAFYAATPFPGVILLQTCSRVEILVHASAAELAVFLEKEKREGFVIYENKDVLLHLSKLAAGLESLIVGEDQILGQMKDALLSAQGFAKSDPVTTACINTAVYLGVQVRLKTKINRGAVSIGSAAVQLAEEICGDLSGRNILVVGGGEMGRLVTKSLAEKKLRAIYVTNRTYENALALAKEVNGQAMHLDKLYSCAEMSDVIISCTAAPHEIIHASQMAEVMQKRRWLLDNEPKSLVIIDIASPCDVEAACRNIPGVNLYTIVDLKGVAEQNLKSRETESRRAEEIVVGFQPEFAKIVQRTASSHALAALYSWAEEIRLRECEEAHRLLANGRPATEVTEGLSQALVARLLEDAANEIRRAAEEKRISDAEKIAKTITGEK